MADPQIALLARRLRALERTQAARKTPQLANSTIVGGAIQGTDVTGETLTMIVGQQFDGTNAATVVTGPPPPQPTVPLVTEQFDSLRLYWDGTFADGSVAPMDFSRVSFHAEPIATYDGPNPLDQTHIVGELTSATGGEVSVSLPGEEHVIYLVAWSQAGKFSTASDIAFGTPVDPQDLQDAADQAAADAATALTAATDAHTVAESAQTAASSAAAAAASAQDDADTAASLAGSAQSLAESAQSAASTADSKAVAAQAAADAAQAAASGASTDAGAALDAATAAQAAADAAADGITTLDGRLDTAEGTLTSHETRISGAEADLSTVQTDLSDASTDISNLETRVTTAEGSLTTLDTNLSTANSNISSLSGRVTTAEGSLTTLDGRVDTAEATITTHESRLDGAESDIEDITTIKLPGKTATIYSASAPTSTGRVVGDTWYDTDDGNKPYRWDGDSWEPAPFGNSAVVNLDAATITTGTLAASRIAAGSIDTTKIATAGLDAGVIKAGTLSAARIGSASITTDKIAAGVLNAGGALLGSLSIGDAISMDPASGITVGQPGGAIRLPSDGVTPATFDGEITARLLNVVDNYSISGNGQLNGVFDLKSGIGDPGAPPSAYPDYPYLSSSAVEFARGAAPAITSVGPVTDSSAIVSTLVFFGSTLRFTNPKDGSTALFPDPSTSAWGTDFYAWGGVASDPARNLYWVLGQDNTRSGNWYLYAIRADTFAKVTEFSVAPATFWPGGYPPLIAVNGNTLYLAWSEADGSITLQTHTIGGTMTAPTYGAGTNTATGWNWGRRVGIGALTVGAFDGTEVAVACCPSDTGFWVCRKDGSPTVAPAGLSGSFNRANNDRVDGGCYSPALGRFVSFNGQNGSGRYWHYSNIKSNTVVRSSVTWYDPRSTADPTGWNETKASGTHETREGPTRDLTVPARSWVNIESPSQPDAKDNTGGASLAEASRIFAGVGSGTRYLQGTVGRSKRTVNVVLTTFGSGTSTVRGTDDHFGGPDRARVPDASLGVFNYFTPDDVGATITGTGIPAGTTITGIVAGSGGQAVTLSNNHTFTGGAKSTVSVVIERTLVGRKVYQLPALATGGATPPTSNEFADDTTIATSPGVIQSLAKDSSNKPRIKLSGDGSGIAGPYAWDKDGNLIQEWIDLGPHSGTGTLKYAIIGGQVYVLVNLTLSTASGANTNIMTSGVPAEILPTTDVVQPAHFGGGAAGFIYVRPSGTILATHATGATRSTVVALFSYPKGI